MRKHKLTLNIFLLIVMTDVIESVAELFMKEGLNRAGIISVTLSRLPELILSGASSYFIWLGVLLYLFNFFLMIAILSRIQLSVAFPLGSTSYIFVPILSMIFLHETLTPLRWIGILLIVSGIHFVSKSTQSQE